MKKKIRIALGIILGLAILLIGIEFIYFLKATSRLKEISSDIEKRIAEWEKKEYRRPPLLESPVPGNAAEYYQQAEKQMHEIVDNTDAWMEWGDYIGSFKPLSTSGLAYYEKSKPIIELVKNGVNTQFYKPPAGLMSRFIDGIPNLLSPRNIANAIVIQGREVENDGHLPEALDSYCIILRYAEDLKSDGSLLLAMLGTGIFETGQNEIQRLLLSHKLSEQDVEWLMKRFNTIYSYETSEQGNYETETLSMMSRYKSTIAKKESFFVFSWLKTIIFVQTLNDAFPIVKEAGRLINLPYGEAKSKMDKIEKRIEAFWNPVTRMSCFGTAIDGWYYHKAQRRGLYVLCALELYKARHQKYPEKLSDLAPEIITEVPLDPFTVQPFIYKVNQDGTIMLYSVSENLKDDNGDAFKNKDIVIAPLKK